VPEILDRNLSRAGDVCLLLSFALTAMMAADQEDDREEEKDAAPHSFFCERISAETGTGGQRRQRPGRFISSRFYVLSSTLGFWPCNATG